MKAMDIGFLSLRLSEGENNPFLILERPTIKDHQTP